MFNRVQKRWRAHVALVAATALGAACPAQAQNGAVAPVTVKELVEARGLAGLMLSPDGKFAVIRVDHQDVVRDATILEWRVVRLADGESWMIADGGTLRWNNNGYIAPETPQWSPDGGWIYFRKVDDQQAQLWRASRDGRHIEQVTHEEADVQAFIVTPEGRVDFAVGPATRSEIVDAEKYERDTGVLLDSDIIVGFPISGSFPVNGRMATYRLDQTSPAGRSTLLGSAPLSVSSLDEDPRRGRSADPALISRFNDLMIESFGGQRISDPGRARRAKHPTAGMVATLEPDVSGTDVTMSRSARLLRIRGADSSDQTCTNEVCLDADHLNIVGWSGQELIFQTRTFETVRLMAWHPGVDVVRTILTTEGVLGSSESGTDGECQIAGAAAICIAAAADDPPKLVSIDLQTGTWRELFDPSPNLTAERLGVARKVTLHDRYGNATVGRVLESRAGETSGDRLARRPLVNTSYACRGFLLGGSGRDVPEHVLAGLGYTAICIDSGGDVVRRATSFSLTQESGNRSFLDFFEDAVRLLEADGSVDRERVLLTGFSASSTATAFAISQTDTFTAAAVTTGGSLDPILCYLAAHYRSCEQLAKAAGLPLPFDYRSGVMEDSPALHADRIRTPLLMQLPEVEYPGMMQLYSVMRDLGRATEMYIFPEAYHYKNQPRQRLAVYQRNLDWAEFWLRGVESEDLRHADQMDRWKRLRTAQCEFSATEPVSIRPWYCRP